MKFAIGNLVTLNSGGPELLVVDYNGPLVVVAWPDGSGKIAEHEFPKECLTLIRRCRADG